MKAKGRFQEARLFVGGGTIALLLGLWSALTVHDIQARNSSQTGVDDNTAVTSAPVDTATTPPAHQPATNAALLGPATSMPATPTPEPQPTTTSATHTRTRAS